MVDIKVPYGCWFDFVNGSGIFVNVGNTLIVHDHDDFLRHFNVSSQHPENISWYSDKFFCTLALQAGYDSFQLRNEQILTICSGNCSTLPLSGACPLLHLRTGVNKELEYNCNNQLGVLNCDNNVVPVENC